MPTIDGGHYGDGVARRTKRLWTDEEKRSICFQTAAPGVSVAQVALRYAVNANLIFKWRRDPHYAADPAAFVLPGLRQHVGMQEMQDLRPLLNSLISGRYPPEEIEVVQRVTSVMRDR